MSGIWRQITNLDISSQDLQDFILTVLNLMKSMSTHSVEGAGNAYPKTGGETRARSQDQFR
jgi:hypothetical protein